MPGSIFMNAEKPSGLPSPVPKACPGSPGFFGRQSAALAVGGLPDIGLYFNGGLGDDIMCQRRRPRAEEARNRERKSGS